MSIVDFDIPFAISFTMAVIIEVPGIIILMAIVTWPILIVAVPVMIAALYVQVNPFLNYNINLSLVNFSINSFLSYNQL